MNQLLLIAAAQRERPSALRVGAVLHATKQSVRPERGPIAGRTSAGGSALTLWISPSTVRPVLTLFSVHSAQSLLMQPWFILAVIHFGLVAQSDSMAVDQARMHYHRAQSLCKGLIPHFDA